MIPREVLKAIEQARFPTGYGLENERADFRRTFLDTDHGVRVLCKLVDRTGWLSCQAPPTQTSTGSVVPYRPDVGPFNEGRRSVMTMIVAIIEEKGKPLQVNRDDTDG